MALVTDYEVRQAAQRARSAKYQKTADSILLEQANTYISKFDIFLSHSIKDSEIVLGAYQLLTETGKKVYVDWIVDPKLDRTRVTPETAKNLRARMNQCDSLFYLHSENSTTSRWMPWELGYFDGHNGNVAIFPIVKSGQTNFRGEEYLGLYPYVDIAPTKSGPKAAFINKNTQTYNHIDFWAVDSDKLRPTA